MCVAWITGAGGFIGRYVAKAYSEKGYYVVGTGHGVWDEPYSKWGIDEWHCGDVTDEFLRTFCKFPDIIIHCAGGSAVGASVLEPGVDFAKTVGSISHVLEFIRKYSPETRLVYLSSAAVYGLSDVFPLNIQSRLNPISPYGTHKKIAEELCTMYGKQYGVKSVIMRLFSVYGNGLRKQLLWDACKKIVSGNNSFFGTGDETRDWIHVADVARYLAEAQSYASSECPVYNLASGKRVRIVDVLNMVFAAMGASTGPVFGGQKDVGNPMHYWADVSGIDSWKTKPRVGLEDGIKSYAKWYKKNAE